MIVNNNLAIVFPGQGSQSTGMLDGLQQDFPEVNNLFNRASHVLGYDLWELVHQGPESELNQTEKTQPALLAAGVATWEILKSKYALSPAYLAGHSLGEYTALVCAGVIAFEDGIKLVAERGRCMQDAVPVGAGSMAAILGLDDDTLIEICESCSDEKTVSAANFNSPGQVVIAGDKSAVEKAVNVAKDAGAKRAMVLPVSVPSHCELMREAATEFAQTLETVPFSDTEIPIIQNVDAVARKNADAIKPVLLQQLYCPVQWVKTIHFMAANKILTILECGPGKVLSGLIKRIDRSLQALPVIDTNSLEKANHLLNETEEM